MSNINIILYNPVSKSSKFGGGELLDEWDALDGAWVWVNITGASDEVERKLLSNKFGVPRLAIQDANRERHPPKLEVFNELIFIMLRDLLAGDVSHEHRVSQLSLFLGANFLVSRHRDELPSVKAIFDTVQSQPEMLNAGPAHQAQPGHACSHDHHGHISSTCLAGRDLRNEFSVHA